MNGNFTRIGIVLVVVVAAVVFGVKSFAADKTPMVGQMAPGFTLPSQDGTNISLDEFKGKWVVLYFYPKDQTSGCTLEAHNFQRDLSKYEAANAVIVGVSVQNADSHKEFCAKQGLTFKLLADTDKKVSEQYGSVIPVIHLSSRHTFLIDPQGKIVKEWLDVDKDIKGHSDDVLAALKQASK